MYRRCRSRQRLARMPRSPPASRRKCGERSSLRCSWRPPFAIVRVGALDATKATILVSLVEHQYKCFTGVSMSKLSRKFKVPDRLANLYDFANSLDVRRFTHYGVPHMQSDELASPRELGVWMSQRGLSRTDAKIAPAMFETALRLRTA